MACLSTAYPAQLSKLLTIPVVEDARLSSVVCHGMRNQRRR
jgi:hypothetical protein